MTRKDRSDPTSRMKRRRRGVTREVLALALLCTLIASGCSASLSAGEGGKLEEGMTAPDFTLPSDDGRTVKLSDYRGKQIVALYFYPKDETPGCTKQACAFRDSFVTLRDAGIEVLGVSVDSVESHKEFRRKQNLNFTLLSDSKKEVSGQYGVLGTLGFAKRVTFVIDKNGVIRKIYRDVNPSQNAADVLAFAKSI
jgi:thioredoxin-dependent peroxiredoxin